MVTHSFKLIAKGADTAGGTAGTGGGTGGALGLGATASGGGGAGFSSNATSSVETTFQFTACDPIVTRLHPKEDKKEWFPLTRSQTNGLLLRVLG